MVELGFGIEKDADKARILYLAAADKGSAKGMNRIGLMHFRGEGVLQDYKAAFEMICKAADLKDTDAAFNCAGLYSEGRGTAKDQVKANNYYQIAAEKNHIGALIALALQYKNGTNGTEKDLKKAYTYFKKAASRGNPLALYEIGLMYEQGSPIPQDLVKAHLYFNLASARQLPTATIALERITQKLKIEEVEKAQTLAKEWKAVTQ